MKASPSTLCAPSTSEPSNLKRLSGTNSVARFMTDMLEQRRILHACRNAPQPPNLSISRQCAHSPQSGAAHPSQSPHRRLFKRLDIASCSTAAAASSALFACACTCEENLVPNGEIYTEIGRPSLRLRVSFTHPLPRVGTLLCSTHSISSQSSSAASQELCALSSLRLQNHSCSGRSCADRHTRHLQQLPHWIQSHMHYE